LNGTTYYADFYEFNAAGAATTQWTAKANFGGGVRTSAVGLSIGATGYIGTGYDGTAYHKDFWAYDTTANAWTRKADFGGVERMSAVALSSVCGDGYIGTGMVPCGICPPCATDCDECPCGKDGLYYSDFWLYDVVNDKWIQMAYYDGGEVTGKRASAVGFSLGTESYFVGTGDDGSTSGTRYYNDFWKYVP
jgi:N-acetylneuraminic acid mutarotase